MPLITLKDGELAYGLTPLLDRAAFAIRSGERVALIGRNGTGKSTLLAVLAGSWKRSAVAAPALTVTTWVRVA